MLQIKRLFRKFLGKFLGKCICNLQVTNLYYSHYIVSLHSS